jgi:hypothetical protein
MTASPPPDPLRAAHLAALASTRALGDLINETPRPNSTAWHDARFRGSGWHDTSGEWPLGVSLLLLCAAGSVVTDLGDLAEAGRGPVSAFPLTRYVIEHIAEIHWILAHGTYVGEDPTTFMTREEHGNLVEAGREMRIRRAALRHYGWTLEFENGRRRSAPDSAAPRAGLPPLGPAVLEAMLEPLGLRTKDGRRRPSEMTAEQKRKASRNGWQLGPGVVDSSMTSKVDSLTRHFLPADDGFPGLYSFLSTSTHPNPFAVAELGGQGRFELGASSMARLLAYPITAQNLGIQLLAGYVDSESMIFDSLHSNVQTLYDEADAFDTWWGDAGLEA